MTMLPVIQPRSYGSVPECAAFWQARGYPPLPTAFSLPSNPTEAEPETAANQPTIRAIIIACAAFYKISPKDIISHRRSVKTVHARQVAMYLAKTLTTHGVTAIGRAIGGRDHSTICHGVRKIARSIETDPAICADVEAIKQAIEGGTGGIVMAQRRLTPRQQRAFDWLPTDHSWRVADKTIRAALNSLKKADGRLVSVEYGLFAERNYIVGRWRLNPEAVETNGRGA